MTLNVRIGELVLEGLDPGLLGRAERGRLLAWLERDLAARLSGHEDPDARDEQDDPPGGGVRWAPQLGRELAERIGHALPAGTVPGRPGGGAGPSGGGPR
jgi:hypothetical protein